MSDVLFETRGRAGLMTLNRPKALNALTHEMVNHIQQQLEQWRDDDAIALVIIQGAGEKAFCAGGDIATIYRQAQDNPESNDAFFADEYQLNGYIADYPKPYIAVMDGIVLGGGLGVSAHGSHRIVTETSRIGMPEVGIGLFPDVGISHILARAPHNLGLHLALTGVHVGAADAIEVGLADTFVERARVAELVDKLAETGNSDLVNTYGSTPPAGLDADRDVLEAAYGGATIDEIKDNLRGIDAEWAEKAVTAMERSCPTSVLLALDAQRLAKELSLQQVLEQDLRLAKKMGRRPDLVEGVRAQIIDKDRNPTWAPAEKIL